MAGGNFFVFVSYLIMIKGYFYAPDLLIVLCFVLIKIYFNAQILILSSCGVAANQAWANIRYFCILQYLLCYLFLHLQSFSQYQTAVMASSAFYFEKKTRAELSWSTLTQTWRTSFLGR